MCHFESRSTRSLAYGASGALSAALVLLIAAAAGAQAPPTLLHSPKIDLSSERPLLSGDVNGDGHVDLVGVRDQYFKPPKLSVYLGDGLGSFSDPVDTIIGPVWPAGPAWPLPLSGGDFDGDGHMDVAYIVQTTPNVEVWFGASDGSFVDPVMLPLSANGLAEGTDLALCDATGDGILDIVGSYATNPSFNARLTVYAGTGGRGFTSPPSQVFALKNPKLVTHGDFDGDGDIDLIAGNETDTVVLWGHGDGSFDLPEHVQGILLYIVEGLTSISKLTGDIDGDGRDDIAFVEQDDVREFLSWKPGVGFIGTPVESESFHPPLSGAIVDIDHDGLVELLYASSDQEIDILEPAGAQVWAVVRRYGTLDYPTSLHVIDIDEDGGLDVVAGVGTDSNAQGHPTILAGQGDGQFQNVYTMLMRPYDVAVADMTGDGFADVVAVFGVYGPAQMLRGRFDGGLDQPEDIDAGPEADQLFLVDATGDGILDLLTTGGVTIAVAAGHGDGSFDPPVLSSVANPILVARLAPFGGDALPDLAVLLREPPSYVSHHVDFLVNGGGGHFTDVGSTLVAPPETDTSDFEAADLDHDQDTDLIVKWNDAHIRLFLNEPTGFVDGELLQVNGDLIGAGDYDFDGDVDVADARQGGFELLSGDGAGGIASAKSYPTPNLTPRTLTNVDLDGDGLLDRLVGGWLTYGGHEDLWLALGTHGGGFTPYTKWQSGAQQLFLRPADVNGDGATDLVICGDFDGQVTVVENGEGPWSKLGHSLAGVAGWSRLQGFGTLTPGSTATLRISNGPPGVPALLVAGHSTLNAPFKGGALVPQPNMFLMLGALDAQGSLQVSGTWPASMPPGGSFAMQVWRSELGAPSGFAATTAIRGTSP